MGGILHHPIKCMVQDGSPHGNYPPVQGGSPHGNYPPAVGSILVVVIGAGSPGFWEVTLV